MVFLCTKWELDSKDLQQQVESCLEKVGVQYNTTSNSTSEQNPTIVFREATRSVTKYHQTPTSVLGVWRGRHPSVCGNPFADPSIRNVIGANHDLDPGILASTLSHIRDGHFLHPENLLRPEFVDVPAIATQSNERQFHMQRWKRFAMEHSIAAHVCCGLESALDEMFANATYHAPIEGDKRLNAHVRRGVSVTSPRHIQVRFLLDALQAVVVVRDEYGSLSPERVIENLSRCYNTARFKLDHDLKTGGLGFFLILQSINRLVINIDPGHFTEVIALRSLDQRRAEFLATAPSLNICVRNHDQVVFVGRKYKRQNVDWPTVWNHGVQPEGAKILDVSPKGAFIRPLGGKVKVDLGTAIDVCMVPASGMQPIYVRGRVRWAGRSYDHGCDGFGIEFDTECEAIRSLLGNVEPSL